ncbi:extracellular solute-binding protein [Alkalibacterium sp.]|nr:MAG: extracellular solute-binding protein [Alkalibacterium sp.]
MNKFVKSLGMVSTIALLAACNNGDGGAEEAGEQDETSTVEDNGGNGGNVNLAVWGSSPAETNALEETISSFEEETGIEVELEIIQDNFQDAMTARFAANNAPDVFYLEAFAAPMFIESGVLENISGEIDDVDDFFDPLIDVFRGGEDELYAVPKDYSTLALYVNEDLLEAAGYSTEDIPRDWDDLMAFADELQGDLEDNQAAMIFDQTLARHYSAFINNGLDPAGEEGSADFTSSPEAIEYFESIIEGKEAGYLQNPQIDMGIDSAGAAFGANRAAMMIEGNWVISALNQEYSDLNYAVLESPTINGEEQSMTFSVGYTVSRDAENREEAIAFINYMTNDGLQQWSELSGTLPPRESVADAMDLFDNPVLEPHVLAAEYGTVWSSGESLPVVASAFDNYFQAAVNGTMTVEEAMQAAEEEANAELDRR